MNKDRNPHNLWEVLGEICSEIEGFSKDLEIKMVGPTDIAIKNALIENNLSENINKIDYVPHSEVVTYLLGAQLLLLPINDTPNSLGVIPGKLFEYLAARRPIICIGPLTGDSCRIINETEAGYTFSFNNKFDLKTALISLYDEFAETGKVECSSNSIEKFSRRNLTGQMAELLNEIV